MIELWRAMTKRPWLYGLIIGLVMTIFQFEVVFQRSEWGTRTALSLCFGVVWGLINWMAAIRTQERWK
jgi:hypothetical protein